MHAAAAGAHSPWAIWASQESPASIGNEQRATLSMAPHECYAWLFPKSRWHTDCCKGGQAAAQGNMRLRCRPAPCLAPLRDRPLCCWARCRHLLRAAVDGVAEGSSCGLNHVATCRIGAMPPLAALLHNRSTTAGSTSGCTAGRTPSVPPPARRCPQTAGRAASQTRPRSSWLTAAGRGVAEGRRQTWCNSGAWT